METLYPDGAASELCSLELEFMIEVLRNISFTANV